MKYEKRTIATATNSAYLLTGLYFALHGLYVPAVGVFSLGVGSGIHHYVQTAFTRKLDYAGMYATMLSLLSLLVDLPIGYEIAAVGVVTFLLVQWLGSDRRVVGALVGAVLVALLWKAGIKAGMEALAFMGIALVFNHIGDNLHSKHHSTIHGAWHIVTAYVILLAGTGLS